MSKTLRDWRKTSGHTQADLASKSGLSTDLISKLENNKLRLTISTARKIADVLEINPYKLQKQHLVQSLEDIYETLEYKLNRDDPDIIQSTKNISKAWRLFFYLVDAMSPTPPTAPPKGPVEEVRKKREAVMEIWEDVYLHFNDYLLRLQKITNEYVEIFQEQNKTGGSWYDISGQKEDSE